MWEITVKSQILTFFYAVTLGIILSVLFDFFKTIRISYKHNNIFVFIEDIVFFLISTFLTFMFLMARCNG